MEVKNQMVDQTLVNVVAQTPAGQSAKASKDADRPDFDSMVHQKRSAEDRAEPRAEKPEARRAEDEAPEEERPVSDERYAIAAAMMYQAQPDARYTAIQAEAPVMEAAPELTAELPEIPVDAEIAVELPELPEMPVETEIPVEHIAEAAPEQAETVIETPEPMEAPRPRAVETPRIEARREAAQQPVSETAQEPTVERPEPQPIVQTPRMAEAEAPREERAVEMPRIVSREEQPETEDDAGTGVAVQQEAPLFEHVEAPVIKVAEASRPIPLEAEDGVEQLGSEIERIVVNDVSANRIEVTLTPEHLGKLTVEVTREVDGTLNVVLHATNERAANLLERGMDGLRQALAANNGREAQIEVRGSEESQQQFLNPDGQNEQNRQQQQQQNRRRTEQRSAQDFLQQLRLGLVDVDGNE